MLCLNLFGIDIAAGTLRNILVLCLRYVTAVITIKTHSPVS